MMNLAIDIERHKKTNVVPEHFSTLHILYERDIFLNIDTDVDVRVYSISLNVREISRFRVRAAYERRNGCYKKEKYANDSAPSLIGALLLRKPGTRTSF